MKKLISALLLALLFSCQSGGVWSAQELTEWHGSLTESRAEFISPLYYRGTDAQYHYFLCRSMDTWVPVQVKTEEIKLTEVKPYVSASQSRNFPGYYAVDPGNGYTKIHDDRIK